MLIPILVFLITVWALGYSGYFPSLGMTLFTFNSVKISLWDILVLLLLLFIIDILPSPFAEVSTVILMVWVMSLLGLFAFIPGLGNILLIFIIVGLSVYLFLPVFWDRDRYGKR